jgi:30S ribosomal protein S31
MGKGDKKTKRGKLYRGTYGKRRLRKKKESKGTAPDQSVKTEGKSVQKPLKQESAKSRTST